MTATTTKSAKNDGRPSRAVSPEEIGWMVKTFRTAQAATQETLAELSGLQILSVQRKEPRKSKPRSGRPRLGTRRDSGHRFGAGDSRQTDDVCGDRAGFSGPRTPVLGIRPP